MVPYAIILVASSFLYRKEGYSPPQVLSQSRWNLPEEKYSVLGPLCSLVAEVETPGGGGRLPRTLHGCLLRDQGRSFDLGHPKQLSCNLLWITGKKDNKRSLEARVSWRLLTVAKGPGTAPSE